MIPTCSLARYLDPYRLSGLLLFLFSPKDGAGLRVWLCHNNVIKEQTSDLCTGLKWRHLKLRSHYALYSSIHLIRY